MTLLELFSLRNGIFALRSSIWPTIAMTILLLKQPTRKAQNYASIPTKNLFNSCREPLQFGVHEP